MILCRPSFGQCLSATWMISSVVGYGKRLQDAEEEGLWCPGCNGFAKLRDVLAGPIRLDIHRE